MERRVSKELKVFVINRVRKMERKQKEFFAELEKKKAKDDLLTVKEITAQFGISTKTIYRWKDNGLQYLQNGPGGKLFIKREYLELYIQIKRYGRSF